MLKLTSFARENWQFSIIVFFIGLVTIFNSGIINKSGVTGYNITSFILGVFYLIYSILILLKNAKDFIYRAIFAICILMLEIIIYMFKKTNAFQLSISEILNFDLSSLISLLFPIILVYIAIIYDMRNYFNSKSKKNKNRFG